MIKFATSRICVVSWCHLMDWGLRCLWSMDAIRPELRSADVPPEARAKPGKTENDLLRHQLPAGLCAVAGKKLPFDASTLVNDMLVSKMSWETTGSFWMKLLGCEVVNGTHGPQVIFSWSFNDFNVCFVLLPGELQLSIRGPVTSICWMQSMRGNWFTNCLKQLACQLIPQTSQQENASRHHVAFRSQAKEVFFSGPEGISFHSDYHTGFLFDLRKRVARMDRLSTGVKSKGLLGFGRDLIREFAPVALHWVKMEHELPEFCGLRGLQYLGEGMPSITYFWGFSIHSSLWRAFPNQNHPRFHQLYDKFLCRRAS